MFSQDRQSILLIFNILSQPFSALQSFQRWRSSRVWRCGSRVWGRNGRAWSYNRRSYNRRSYDCRLRGGQSFSCLFSCCLFSCRLLSCCLLLIGLPFGSLTLISLPLGCLPFASLTSGGLALGSLALGGLAPSGLTLSRCGLTFGRFFHLLPRFGSEGEWDDEKKYCHQCSCCHSHVITSVHYTTGHLSYLVNRVASDVTSCAHVSPGRRDQ